MEQPYNSVWTEEVSSLEAIYPDSIIKPSSSSMWYCTKIMKEKIWLMFDATVKYPQEPLTISIRIPNKKAPDLVHRIGTVIQCHLQDQAKHLVGREMIKHLILAAESILPIVLQREEAQRQNILKEREHKRRQEKLAAIEYQERLQQQQLEEQQSRINEKCELFSQVGLSAIEYQGEPQQQQQQSRIDEKYAVFFQETPTEFRPATRAMLKELVRNLTSCEGWKRVQLSKKKYRTIPEELLEVNPHDMDLSYNLIMTIPPKVEMWSNLQKLNFSHNQLTVFPLEISKLTNLKTLDVSYNQIAAIPENIINCLTNLVILNLSHNKLTKLPSKIDHCTLLETIDLTSNRIKLIPADIAGLPQLTRLYLRNNPILAPPAEVYWRGTTAILSYMKEHLADFASVDSSLGTFLIEQLNNPTFSDAQFVVKNKRIFVHKAVLAARCPKLLALFEKQQTNEVEIEGIEYQVLMDLLVFVYSDFLQISSEITEIQNAAKEYDVPITATLLDLPEKPPTVESSFATLYETKLHSDLQLKSEDDQVIRCHNVIVGGRSEYFKALIGFAALTISHGKEEDVTQDVTDQKTYSVDTTGDILRAVLEFLYTDDIAIAMEQTPDIILDLFATASRYNLDALKRICESIIGYNIDVDNVACIYSFAELYQSTNLMKVCSYFIITNWKAVRRTEAFAELPNQIRSQLLESYNKLKEGVDKEYKE